MKKLLFVAVAFAGLTLVSCNKDQSAVNKLDGSWTVTKLESTSGGTSYDPIAAGDMTMSMTYTKCKLKTDEWCTTTYTQTITGWPSYTESDVYRVTGDGTTLEVKDSDTSSTIWTTTIEELTKSTFRGTSVDGSTTTTIEATKN